MKAPARFVPAAAAAIAVAAFAAPAASAATNSAAGQGSWNGSGAVFALTDNTAGNAVAAYQRAADGKLTPAGTYSTHGLGGILSGSVVDHTASQGALVYDKDRGLLFAVNPGSNTVAVFNVDGDRLALSQVLSSGGDFPVSVTVHGDHAYVLNAFGGGSLYGYQIDGGWLTPIPRSYRALNLGTTATSAFTATPGQVSFTPDGSQLLVSTKATGSDVDVFAVGADGRLSASPVVNSIGSGTVPFAITYDPAGHAVLSLSGGNSVATESLSSSGKLTQLDVAPAQNAACWVVKDGKYYYVANPGSNSVSGYTVSGSGELTALGNTTTDAGTVDLAGVQGKFLYARTGAAGLVDEFAVGANGSLTSIGSVTVPGGVGGEGIAAF